MSKPFIKSRGTFSSQNAITGEVCIFMIAGLVNGISKLVIIGRRSGKTEILNT